MNHEEYENLHKFELFYWWHVGRRHIVNLFLQRIRDIKGGRILEIGCGTGGNLKTLSEWGRVTGLDVSEKALEICRRRGFENLVLGNAEKIGFPDESFDLVVALDVLEHIEKDEKALRECFRVLKKGGFLLASVPAYEFLWSEHDEVLGHHRRYFLSGFVDKIEKAGFKEFKSSYLVTFVFPLVLAYRFFRKIFLPNSKRNLAYVVLPKFLNDFFILLLKIEGFLMKYFNFPFGTSIICLAQEPKV